MLKSGKRRWENEFDKNEIEVMDVFWGVGRPLSRAELLNLSVDKSWQSNSVHILLNNLLKKGALREAGFARSGKTYGRTFEAALTCEEYYAASLYESIGESSLPALLTALLRVYNPQQVVLDQMAEVLNQRQTMCQVGI